MDKEIIKLARQLGEVLKDQGIKIATAESCTGGGIAQAITDIPGSSAWFDRGFVTYSNAAKLQMLQVKQATLGKYGAVSEEVAIEMVEGALLNSVADLAVSVTGIAGPGGGSIEKPVGTVYIAWQKKTGNPNCKLYVFSGNRLCIREQTVKRVLSICRREFIEQNQSIFLMDNKHSLYQKSEIYLKQLLKEKLPENSRFFLFGSRAKGTSGKTADIDIGILAESIVPLEIMTNIKETIKESFVPYDVDLVDFNTASESFKQQALKKVIPWN